MAGKLMTLLIVLSMLTVGTGAAVAAPHPEPEDAPAPEEVPGPWAPADGPVDDAEVPPNPASWLIEDAENVTRQAEEILSWVEEWDPTKVPSADASAGSEVVDKDGDGTIDDGSAWAQGTHRSEGPGRGELQGYTSTDSCTIDADEFFCNTRTWDDFETGECGHHWRAYAQTYTAGFMMDFDHAGDVLTC